MPSNILSKMHVVLETQIRRCLAQIVSGLTAQSVLMAQEGSRVTTLWGQPDTVRHDVYAQENDCACLNSLTMQVSLTMNEEGLMSDLDLGALVNHAEVPCSVDSDAAQARQSAMHPSTTYFISTRTCGRSPVGSVKPPSMPKNGT